MTKINEGKIGVPFRNLWWTADNTENAVMFSLRFGSVWRAFPGPADGPTLDLHFLSSRPPIRDRDKHKPRLLGYAREIKRIEKKIADFGIRDEGADPAWPTGERLPVAVGLELG